MRPEMLRYVFDQHQMVAGFVAAMIPHCRRGFGNCVTIGVTNTSDELIAGIVYHQFDPEHGVIEMSAAALPGSRWLTPMTLKVMYQFPFHQLGCQMVLMRTRTDNEHILRMLAAFGYMLINVPRMYGRHTDGVVCLLTDDDWAANKVCQKYGHHIRDDAAIEEAA